MTTPKPEIGKLLTEAYQYWMRTLPFQFLFSVIYFSVTMFADSYAFRYYGLFEEVQKFQNLFYSDFEGFMTKLEVLMQTPNGKLFAVVALIVKAVIFPLNLGFLKIYRKLDIGEKLNTSDLFAGFRGHYFFLFVIYSFVWSIINNYLSIFTFIWIPMMLFVPALIFYKGFNFLKSFQISIQTFQKYFILIFVATIVSILFSYCGFIMFFFGIFLTFPFWNAMIYVLYKHLIADFDE
ncbi:hypothetical protein [Epilithonimonas sp. UC225_85]|uniref:hypothetical protein n=1 Tax=Epilithonimonas sp. UC225_85 TaxID=3350167 RepID=UPI0036D25EB6